MTERDALLRAVCDNPDDDIPRLVFADWLQENGEEARAEFIRLQIRMSRSKKEIQEVWSEWQRLCAWEQEILRDHDETWWRELPDAPGYRLGRLFTRGFIETLYVNDWSVFLRDAEILFASSPLQSGIFRCSVDFSQPKAMTYLARFRRLGLWEATLSETDWLSLLEAPLPLLVGISLRGLGDNPFRDQIESRFGKQLYHGRY